MSALDYIEVLTDDAACSGILTSDNNDGIPATHVI
jgi:hypothetical protein